MNNSTVVLNGQEIFFSAAVALMDDGIREALHSELAPCTEQEFMDAYAERHKEEFGETFQVN